MPEKGDTVSGKDIGKRDGIFIYDFCVDCGEGDWVQKQRDGRRDRCRRCHIQNQKRTFMQKY